jgi:pyrroloquinoline-quinone synthase
MRLLYTTALYWDYVSKDIPISELETIERKVPQHERQLLQA